MKHKTPPTVWIGLAIAIGLDTFVQLTWKMATRSIPDSLGPLQSLRQILLTPVFHITLILWVAQFSNWMLVLARSDLSFAQPMTALSYLTVASTAALFFHEHVSPLRVAGIILIILGAWQMSVTEHRTPREPALGQAKPPRVRA